ncbi:TraB/GumN family protein [Dyella amyloliquefaciens]|uniref:TraB/GumN family protein n=1 Tax=Dyella amyloliquefaciens TaxID=1770545 RepID=UPI0013EEA0A8|nr:TraB/GumN family protein [Dyella amyloliquefaciens]
MSASALAQQAPPAPTTSSPETPAKPINLQAVTVRGAQPGPALWEVRKGDHVLWILGTISPLPKYATWQWTQLEQALGKSSEMLEAPSARLKMPPSLFSRLALQPAARLNPGGATLEHLLPSDMYERWRVLRREYLHDDDAYEYQRPIIVAEQLFTQALSAHGLTGDTDIEDIVEKLARKHGARQVPVRYELVIRKVAEPTGSVDSDQQQGIACLDETMQIIEHDMSKLTERANAWATGDTSTLQKLMQGSREPCVVSAINGDFEHQLNVNDLPQRINAAWVKEADLALTRNRRTVAVLTMEQLMSPTGYLATLRSMGYLVQPPADLKQ